MIVHVDIETRSAIDLTEVGAHRYAEDPSTVILMAAVGCGDQLHLWVNPKLAKHDSIENGEALRLLGSADLIYAHNAGFEQPMFSAKGWTEMGFQPVLDQWRCTAAMARKAGLPSSLEKCAAALGLTEQKDRRGKALIRKFSLPREDGSFEPCTGQDWEDFKEYCRQDVRVEMAIHHRLSAFELTNGPLETFQFDMRLNQRGIPVNVPALTHAQMLIDGEQVQVTKEFQKLTGLNPTQREKVRLLVGLPDMQAETLEAAKPEDPKIARILNLYSRLSFAAAKKVRTMLDCACADQRIRGGHLYYGAGTGRWSGKLVQPQNFKKTPGWMRKMTDTIYGAVCDGILPEELSIIYGEPVELMSGIIRHFIHAPGHKMLDADYNAIEARIICWLSGEEKILDMWRSGRDLYRYMASLVYAIPEAQIAKDSDYRDMGKRIELGCGYGMGAKKFLSTCEQFGAACDTSLAERCVEVYRTSHQKVVQYWYKLDEQCRQAIEAPGVPCGPFVVKSLAGMPYLLFRLRSGRSLAYPRPAIELEPGDTRTQITYWDAAVGRVKLYGGKLAENETQATAADIMAHGAITAEKKGYEIFMLVHDQALALQKEGQTADEFAACLASLPDWATGMPLKVEAKVAPYYRK